MSILPVNTFPLQAALFFALLLCTSDDDIEKNTILFEDRWLNYTQTKWKLKYLGELLR